MVVLRTSAAIPLRLHDEVVARLRGMILRCELMPGSRISERELCERFGISRTPLREAFKVLAASGLMELWPNRGARIAPLVAAEVADVFNVLALLEERAGNLAAANLEARRIADIERLHKRMVGYAEQHQPEQLLRVDLQIHRVIVRAAGSAALLSVHDELAARIERARYMAGALAGRIQQAMEEHELILSAVLARDGERIGRELHSHCIKTRDVVVSAIESGLGAGPG